jgi:hypothetical protein
MKIPLAFLIGLAVSATFDTPAAELPKAPATESLIPTGNNTNVVLLYGGGYKHEVPRSKLATLPDWTVESNTIPLLPQQAARIALARFSSLHPTITNIETSNITMVEVTSIPILDDAKHVPVGKAPFGQYMPRCRNDVRKPDSN